VPPAWCSIEPHDNLWAHWDDDYVIYHRASGKTHFVNAATAELLNNILLVPKTAVAAAEELAASQEASGDAAFFAEVARLLERLEYAGLVERRDG
jgi:PqqD family protein of HPr-rel-A system